MSDILVHLFGSFLFDLKLCLDSDRASESFIFFLSHRILGRCARGLCRNQELASPLSRRKVLTYLKAVSSLLLPQGLSSKQRSFVSSAASPPCSVWTPPSRGPLLYFWVLRISPPGKVSPIDLWVMVIRGTYSCKSKCVYVYVCKLFYMSTDRNRIQYTGLLTRVLP